MSNLAIYLLALSSLSPALAVSALQDLAAFPKYEVQVLHNLPIHASDATACRAHGLAADDDFLTLHPPAWRPKGRETIEGGVTAEGSEGGDSSQRPYVATDGERAPVQLVQMHYAAPDSGDLPHAYMCALPSANTTGAQFKAANELPDEPEPDPVASWAALRHLEGMCLYARVGWFTYAYCHNDHIRQFRAAPISPPHPPEGHVPKEDPEYDAYTLGKARPVKKHRSALPPGQRAGRRGNEGGAVARRPGQKPKAEGGAEDPKDSLAPETTAAFGVGPTSRYLVQRWTDGTPCDKTGRPREVEVQVHCAMGSVDVIYHIKEVAICQYELIIHSPYLCSLPGFRPSSANEIAAAPIRCREVLDAESFAAWEATPEDERLGLPESIPSGGGSTPHAEERARKDADAGGTLGIDPKVLAAVTELLKHKGDRAGDDDKGILLGLGDEDVDGAAAEGEEDPVFLVSWETDEEGNSLPLDLDSLPPTQGKKRREFLQRLQEFINSELAASEENEDEAGDAPREGQGEAVPEVAPEREQHARDEL